MPSASIRRLLGTCVVALSAAMAWPCHAQTQDPGAVVTSIPCHFGSAPPRPGPACLLAHQDLGALPHEPVYWHIDQYASEAEARSAAGPQSTVVSDFGTVWLFTVAAKGWKAKGATHAATIGPLPMPAATDVSAEYVHSLFAPGMSAPIHKHSGPETFYALDGDTCLETPNGVHVATGPGNQLLMPAGHPMLLMAIGKVPRRAFALILHDTALPSTTRVGDWVPAGLCEGRLSEDGKKVAPHNHADNGSHGCFSFTCS